ncbi:MAG TPA: sigma-70 family RNA polymerase sigma factor, partial [Desulfurivibrionaceae bacterium]|nr:sigma-70 family RNA polymerase sigma factor [Desulfurivibrionaceae bacterium]
TADSITPADEEKWAGWMRRAQEGDESAYRKLLEELGGAIENFLASRLGRVEFLEDIVQESLLAIHQARHTWDPARPFRPWMFAIVRYKSIDMLRRRTTRSQHEEPLADDAQDGQQQVAYGGESILEGEQVFQDLKPQYREALILTRIVGLSIAEAAEQCGVSEVAMRVRVHRALKDLARTLE